MGYALVGVKKLWNASSLVFTPGTAWTLSSTRHVWFTPANTLVHATTEASDFPVDAFHKIDLGGRVDRLILQAGITLDAITGDRVITLNTGSLLQAFAQGMYLVSGSTTFDEPETVGLVDAVNSNMQTAWRLSHGLGLVIRAHPLDALTNLIPESGASLGVTGLVAATSGVAANALLLPDGGAPAATDRVQWMIEIGKRTTALQDETPTAAGAALTGDNWIGVGGLQAVWVAMKAIILLAAGGTTDISSMTFTGQIYALMYRDVMSPDPGEGKVFGFRDPLADL